METIKYNNLTITPIMKPMLCWNNDEANATEQFILAKIDPSNYPWRGGGMETCKTSFRN